MRRAFKHNYIQLLGTVFFTLISTAIVADFAKSASYPNQPIELVNCFGPGGGSDMDTRLAAGYISKKWNIPVNVVNKPGASGMIGTRYVLTSKPDGYTLMNDNHATSAMMAAIHTDLPFKWENRTVIARVTINPVIIGVKFDAPWRSLQEMVDHIRKNPKVVKWGCAGITAVGAFAIAQFLQESNIPFDNVNQVVFKSGSEVLTALAGGHIDFAAQIQSENAGLIMANKIRGLATITSKRLSKFPDIPTAKESGFPTLNVSSWQGISGPPGLPKEIVDKWAKALEEASVDPVFIERGEKQYSDISILGPKEFWGFMQAEYQKYLKMAIELGLRK